MNEHIKNGGPAFPVPDSDSRGYIECSHAGMTLRDYFAAKAMASMVMTIFTDDDYERYRTLAEKHGCGSVSMFFARESYKQADAMLAAREAKS